MPVGHHLLFAVITVGTVLLRGRRGSHLAINPGGRRSPKPTASSEAIATTPHQTPNSSHAENYSLKICWLHFLGTPHPVKVSLQKYKQMRSVMSTNHPGHINWKYNCSITDKITSNKRVRKMPPLAHRALSVLFHWLFEPY